MRFSEWMDRGCYTIALRSATQDSERERALNELSKAELEQAAAGKLLTPQQTIEITTVAERVLRQKYPAAAVAIVASSIPVQSHRVAAAALAPSSLPQQPVAASHEKSLRSVMDQVAAASDSDKATWGSYADSWNYEDGVKHDKPSTQLDKMRCCALVAYAYPTFTPKQLQDHPVIAFSRAIFHISDLRDHSFVCGDPKFLREFAIHVGQKDLKDSFEKTCFYLILSRLRSSQDWLVVIQELAKVHGNEKVLPLCFPDRYPAVPQGANPPSNQLSDWERQKLVRELPSLGFSFGVIDAFIQRICIPKCSPFRGKTAEMVWEPIREEVKKSCSHRASSWWPF